MGRADLKREAIERIDELIIGPMLAGLGALDDFALLLMPDHATPSQLKTHSNGTGTVRADDVGAVQVGSRRCRVATPKPTAPRRACSVGDGYHLIESLFGRVRLETASN